MSTDIWCSVQYIRDKPIAQWAKHSRKSLNVKFTSRISHGMGNYSDFMRYMIISNEMLYMYSCELYQLISFLLEFHESKSTCNFTLKNTMWNDFHMNFTCANFAWMFTYSIACD